MRRHLVVRPQFNVPASDAGVPAHPNDPGDQYAVELNNYYPRDMEGVANPPIYPPRLGSLQRPGQYRSAVDDPASWHHSVAASLIGCVVNIVGYGVGGVARDYVYTTTIDGSLSTASAGPS